MKSRIVLLGPPASGKGTMATMLSKRFQFPSASTGEMLREENRAQTELGREANSYTKEGRYFPDSIALSVVEHWMDTHAREGRFLLDGFPRTLGQAEQFDELLAKRDADLELAVHFELAETEIRHRVEARLTCSNCGQTFSERIDFLKESDACPHCQSELSRRNDDALEMVSQRLAQHRLLTEPVIEFYKQSGRLLNVDAAQNRKQLFEELVQKLEENVK